jgi:hypothetical protein
VKFCYKGATRPRFALLLFQRARALFFETMQDIINVLAISPKGKSRIGTKLTTAIVEQDHHDKMFVVFNASQCRWIKKDNDPDFRIIGDD